MNILKYIQDSSQCLGILGVDATLLENYIAGDERLVNLLECTLGEYAFHRSCFDVCVGIRGNVDPGVLQAFDEFKEQTGYNPRTDLIQVYELNRRPRDAIIQNEMRPAVKRHVEYLATTKLLEFLTLRVEQVLWEARERENFKGSVEFLARRLRENLLCGVPLETKAIPAIIKIINDWSLPLEVQDSFLTIVSEIRHFTTEIRGYRPEPKKPPKKQPKNPYFSDYMKGIQYARKTVMRMARYFGDAMESVRKIKIQACKAVTEQQPYVRKSKYWEGITKYYSGYKAHIDFVGNNSKYSLLTDWYNNPRSIKGQIGEQECELVKEIYQEIVERRRQLFSEQPSNPGSLFLGSSFTLLPIRSLNKVFVNIDHDSLTVWLYHDMKQRGITKKVKGSLLPERNWWQGFFNPYSVKTLELREKRINSSKKFRVIRSYKKKKVQIPYLSKSRNMMLNDSVYEAARIDKSSPVPVFVSNIRTDGVQVKLLLKTLAGCYPTARNVDLLVKKGYSEIKNSKGKKLDILKDTRGVYDEVNVKKLTKAQVALLKNEDVKVELLLNDPGLVEMVTWAKSNVFDDPIDLARTPAHFGSMSSSEYRVLSLSRNASKWEENRRNLNTEYKKALEKLSQERLNHDKLSLISYCKTRNSQQSVLESELLSSERSRLRFIRFRAQQRAIRFLARKIVGRNPLAAEAKSEKRMKKKAILCSEQSEEINKRLELRENLRQQLGRLRFRVVVFGKGIFNHGRAGPCPRKKLIKKLAEIAVVILIDEYRTSKMCCGACGCECRQLKGSRVLRCQSENKDEGVSLSVSAHKCPLWNSLESKAFEIDRDQNATVNMFRIGQGILFNGKRPSYLVRSKSEEDDDIVG